MTVFNVANAQQLTAALSQAQGGDQILLAGGNYGDFVAGSLKYSSNVTIQSASQSNPAVFNSFHLNSSQNIAISDISVHLTPTATSQAWDAAVAIDNSTGITFSNSTVTGGPAINGVPQTATVLDSSGNVLGLPTGEGITIVGSTGVSLIGNTLSQLDEGVDMSNSSAVNIVNNQISGLRHGAIHGGGVSNVTISGNVMSDSTPWAWNTSYGDHADFIHIWTTPPTQTSAANITITNNVISQGAGTAIMGINFEAETAAGQTTPLGFSNVNITDNSIVLGNAQGMRLENLANSNVSNNTLIEPASGGVATPGILFAQGATTNTTVTGNIAGSISSEVSSATLTLSGNQIAQDIAQGAAAYFGQALASQAASLTSASAIQALVMSALPATTTAVVYQSTAANIVANLTALGASTSIASIVITDNAPVTLTVAQLQSSSHVLSELVNQNGSSVSFVISDTAATIANALNSLNGLANLKSIVVTDNQQLVLTAAQVAQDTTALAHLVNANGSAPVLYVRDTAANIASQLNSLMSASQSVHVTATDGGTITLSAAQFVNDQSLLANINGESGYSIRDTAANIDSQLSQLSALQKASGAHFSSLVVTDNQPIQMSIAQLSADANVVQKLTNGNGAPIAVTVVDTGANILANLNSLNWTSNIGSIVVSDGDTLTLTSAVKNADAAALSKLVYADGSPVHIVLGASVSAAPTVYSAAAANVSAALGALNASTQPISIADNQALTLSVAQALSDGQALSRTVNANGTAAVVNVVDTAANILANLNSLATVHGLGAIAVSGGAPLNMSMATLSADASAVSHMAAGSVVVADTAATIASNLAALGANSQVASISVSDDNMVRVSQSAFAADASGLAKIAGQHVVDELNITGQTYTSELSSYNASGVLVSDTFIAANGTRTIDDFVGGQVISSQPAAQTIQAVGGGNTYDFMPNFGSEVISGMQVGTDHLGFSSQIVSSAAAALALASDDGHGDVVFHIAPNETITLMGVTMSQLAAQHNLFHFF